jgi:hypothetical protein
LILQQLPGQNLFKSAAKATTHAGNFNGTFPENINNWLLHRVHAQESVSDLQVLHHQAHMGKKFMGSSGLWGRNGHWYSLFTTLAAFLKAASTSPSLRRTSAVGLSSNSPKILLWSAVLSSSLFSYSIFKASLAFFTCQVDLPTTATLF